MKRAPRLLLLVTALMLGAMAPVPRAIPMTASAGDAASCCCAEEASALGCVSVGGCNGCATMDGASGTGTPSGDLHCDPSMSCVLCLCGIGLVAVGPSIPEPMINDFSREPFELIWSSIEVPPAQPPPEGTFSVS